MNQTQSEPGIFRAAADLYIVSLRDTPASYQSRFELIQLRAAIDTALGALPVEDQGH
jgi:hypothetical protein